MIDELTERRLADAFSAAVVTVPSGPPTTWAEARARQPHPRVDTGEPPRMRRGRRIGLVAVVVGGLVGAGAGIAAAAGAFSSRQVWGSAFNLTLTGNWSEPTEATRVAAPGPGQATIVVGSSSVPQGTCEALEVRMPGAEPTIVGSWCQGSFHTTTAPRRRRAYGSSTAGWTASTGTRYAISYGEGPSGTASVAFASPSGTRLVTGVASAGWYVVAVPAADVGHGNAVTYYGSNGATLGTGPSTGSFATPTSRGGHVPSPSSGKGSQGVAPMYAVGYAGVRFTSTGQAVFELEDGKSVTVPAHVAISLLEARAKTGTPPLPVTGNVPPTVPATSVIVKPERAG